MNTEHPYILDILYSYHVSNQGKIVYLCWIPSHICIHGDNETDKAAKSALEFWYVKFKISSTDLKQLIKLSINSLWQIFCDVSKLYSIQNIPTWVHILWLAVDFTSYIFGVFRHLTCKELFNNFLITYSLCKTFLPRLVSIIFCSFCKSLIFTRRFLCLKFIWYFYVRWKGRSMVPRIKGNNPFRTQETVSLDF